LGNWDFTAAATSYLHNVDTQRAAYWANTRNGPLIIQYPTNFRSMISGAGLSPEVCTTFFNNLSSNSSLRVSGEFLNLGSVPVYAGYLTNSDNYILWSPKPADFTNPPSYIDEWNNLTNRSLTTDIYTSYYRTGLSALLAAHWSVEYINSLAGQTFTTTIYSFGQRMDGTIPQFTISQFINAGYSVSKLLSGGYTLNQIIASGYPINNLLTTDGYQLSDLSNVTMTKTQLNQANIPISQLFDVGFSITQLVRDGYSISDLSSCVFTKTQWQSAGYSPLQLFNAGFSISTFLTDGFQLSDLSSCPFTKSQWTAQDKTPVQLQGAGFSIQNLITDGFQLQDLTETTYTGAQWIAAGYTIIQLFNAGFTTQQMITLGFPVPRFSFEVESSALYDPNTAIYPILNNNNSFTGIYITRGRLRAAHVISIYWVSYTNLSPQDGLNFSTTPYFSASTLKITNFGGVPLAMMTGTSDAAFYHFAGQITAPDVPTIPNHSLNSCFYGATCSNFGNINGWDVSGVTDLTATFENCPNFNAPLDKWSTQSVTSMRNTFNGCSSFTQDISMWNFSGVKPTISQGSIYNIINETAINPARTSKFLLSIINSS